MVLPAHEAAGVQLHLPEQLTIRQIVQPRRYLHIQTCPLCLKHWGSCCC